MVSSGGDAMPSGEAARGGVCKVMRARDKRDVERDLKARKDSVSEFANDIERGLKVSQASMNREIKI